MTTFKEFERDAWERKASRYPDTWGTLTIQPIEAVLDAAKVCAKTELLDCGCGPGHLAYRAVERGAIVTGCDYSKAMLRIANANYPKLNFHFEDAEALSFSGSSFDAVILNFLLLHVADQPRVLLEAKRVLKPMGRLVYSVWLPPAESPGLKLVFDAIAKYADTSVIPPAQDIFMFARADHAAEFLKLNGFSNIKFQRFETYWQVPTAEAFFSAVQAGTRMGGMIELQKPEIKVQIRQSIDAALSNCQTLEGYIIPTPSIIVSAQKESAN